MGSPQALQESARSERPGGDPSVSSSLEHLIAGSQGVITKRLDLALLETQEILSRVAERAAVAGLAILLAAGTWFALAAALVLLVAPDADSLFRLTFFGLINAAGTLGLLRFVQRHGVSLAGADRAADHGSGNEPPARTPSPSDARI